MFQVYYHRHMQKEVFAMTEFDFTSILDRHGKDAIAVDMIPIEGAEVQEGFDRIPMWVADMNFPVVPSITEELQKRINHPAYGYFPVSDDYYNAIIQWQKTQNHVDVLKEDIGYENGVLGGVATALNVLACKGDWILLHSPIYIGFRHVLEDSGYHIVYSPLKKDDKGVWRMDYKDMAEKIEKYKIHTAIFCSPHNPCGRVWEKEEIEQAMKVYEDHQVNVISDEIWSDLILPGHQHIPTQSVSGYAREHTIALYAPSKTFNLAGLIGSYHIIYSKLLRDQMDKTSALTHYNSMNVLSMHALIGGYSEEGRTWLNELREVLNTNLTFAVNYIHEHFKGVEVSMPQGTYMLFLDCTEWCREHNTTIDELLKKGVSVGVIWQDGRPFKGECHIRMNTALPASRVEEAFHRLDKYVFNA